MSETVPDLPPEILALALKEVAGVELDPAKDSFETQASHEVARLQDDETAWEQFVDFVARTCEFSGIPQPYPEEPGELSSSRRSLVSDNLNELDPTGWTADHDESRRPTVMVIDDSVTVTKSISRDLRAAGYDVVTANDGWDALGRLDAEKVDLLLVDIVMPRINGIELVGLIHSRHELADMAVVMMTGDDVAKWQPQVERVGAGELISKGLPSKDFVRRILARMPSHA